MTCFRGLLEQRGDFPNQDMSYGDSYSREETCTHNVFKGPPRAHP